MFRLLAGLLLALIALPNWAQGNLVVILDGSGSMWGRLPGDIPRIVAARQALEELAVELAGRDLRLGLVAYGHRRRGSCKDIATVVEPGPLDPQSFAAQVRRVNPLGMTPIAGAIRHAAALLKPLEGPSTLLLISDGLENCRQDPCRTVEQLRQGGADFTLQVVGLALGETDPEPLRCMARAGGGHYRAVEEAAPLAPTLAELVAIGDRSPGKETVIPQEAAPPAEESDGQDYTIGQLAPLEGSSQLVVTVTLDGAPAGAEVTVYPAGSRRRLARALVYPRSGGNGHTFPLEPGRYDLEVTPRSLTGEPTRTLEGVEVGGAGEALKVDFQSGTLTLGATVNGRPVEADIRVLPSGGGSRLAWERLFARPAGNPRTLRLPPGRYDVEVQLPGVVGEPVQRLEGVEIKPAEGLERQVALQAGELTLTVTVNGRPASGDVTVLPAGGGQRLLWKRIYNRAGDNPYTFLLPPGGYTLRVTARELAGRPDLELAGLEIGPGEVVTRQADFPAGELVVAVLSGAQPALADVSVYPSGGQTRLDEARLYPRPQDNPHTFLLPPDRYDLEVEGAQGQLLERFIGIEIAAGQRVERTLRLPAP